MSATNASTELMKASSTIASVVFCVDSEKRVGHGEELFLVLLGTSPADAKRIPMMTNPSLYPLFQTCSEVSIPSNTLLTYRYEIHRSGRFHRFETDPSGNVGASSSTDPDDVRHLELLNIMPNEPYQVNDILGKTMLPPQINSLLSSHLERSSTATSEVSSLHHRSSSAADAAAFITLRGPTNATATSNPSLVASAPPSNSSTPIGTNRKKFPVSSSASFSTNSAKTTTPFSPPPVVQSVNLNSTDGLVVVSIFLPVILRRDTTTSQWTADWDYEMLLSMQTHLRVTRIGVIRATVPTNQRGAVEDCLRRMQCVPVWVDPNTFSAMYNGFCKGVLWPVLHNVTSVYSHRPDDNRATGEGTGNRQGGADSRVHQQQFSEYSMEDVEQGPIHGGRGHEAELWRSYNVVNRLFADAVVQCFNRGDLVWIHGFHHLILPSYLIRRLPMAKTGIFLHTPFPSSEIFRTLWCREDLLRGMLNADQVGFHLFEYARHFLTSCRRLLGLNYGMIADAAGGQTLAIDTNGRHVAVTSIHAGVEPTVLNQILSHSSTIEKAAQMRNHVQHRHVFCAIDRLESLKGVPLKLLGLERFLQRCPEWVGKVVLVQVGIAALERADDYHQTRNEVSRLAAKINAQWPGTVQFYEETNEYSLQQRMAVLRAADTVVITAIRDGLNLLPLEFTIAHQDAITPAGQKDGRKRGLCILSEFSSCTRVMRGALHINPWKIAEIANAFHHAVNISEGERLRRIRIASEFVTRVTTQRWALAVMLDLKGVQKSTEYSGAGLGLNYRLLGMHTGFKSLDTGVVAKAYRKSSARLIFVDYGGTIVENDNLDNLTRFQMVKARATKSVLTSNMISALKSLCQDKRNTVFVVSGKEKISLTDSPLGDIPNLGLAAEHGMFISWPKSKLSGERRWETLVPDTDQTWRSLAVNIMEVYTTRTHGSYIEKTEMKVLWQYRDADTEFGSLQAKELEDHLSKYLRSYPVDILHGGIKEGGFVEVRPKGVNKGVLAMRVMKRFPEIAHKSKIDFALVLGDDHCDEPMLSVMRQLGRRVIGSRRAARGEDPLPEIAATIQQVDVSACDSVVSPDLEVFTATVGKKPSAAANYLHDVDEVQELFDSLVKLTTIEHRSHSLVSLASYAAAAEAADFSDLPPMMATAPLGGGFRKSQSMNMIAASFVPSFQEYMNPMEPIDDMEEDDIGLAI